MYEDLKSVQPLMRYYWPFSSRREIGWMLVIGLLALGLRLLYASEYIAHPLGRLLWVDEIVYWERARAILRGCWLPDRPFFQDPLIHYLLAGVMSLLGTEVSTIRVALICMGAFTPVVTYWVGQRALGQTEGILAGLALAIYGPLVFTDGQLEKEGIGALATALALAGTMRAAEPNRSTASAALAGYLWGIVTLLRANAILIALVGVVWWLICPNLALSHVRRRTSAVGFLAGFILALAPVSLVNLIVSRPHEFILTTWQGGAMFYAGNGPEASGIGEPSFIHRDPHIEASDFTTEAERRTGRLLTPGQVSAFWMSEGIKRWREAPTASLRFLGLKISLLLNDLEIPDSQSIDWVRLAAAPSLSLAFLSFGWLTPWAAIGLARTQRSPFWWFLVVTTVVGLGSTAIFLVLGRYRVPWAPGLALLAATGLVDLRRQLAKRQWQRVTWRLLLIAVPVATLSWRPEVDPDPDRWGYFQLALFIAYLQAGDVDAAIDVLDDARAANPRAEVSATVLAHGSVHDLLATAISRRWVNVLQDPASALVRARLARVIPETHKLAGHLLEEASRALPDSPIAWRERGGWWLGQQHEDPSARSRALKAYRQASDDPSGRISLALLTSNSQLLDGHPIVRPERLRLARAVITAQRARSPGTRFTSEAKVPAVR